MNHIASFGSSKSRIVLFATAFSWYATGVDAQTIDLRFRSEQDLGSVQQKSIFSALVPLDPEVKFSFDGASMKVRVAENIDLVTLEQALGSTGAGPFQRVFPTGTVATKDALDSFPAYIDTGNPQQDEADLAARKEAWAQAYPEAHAAYLERVREALHLGLPLPQ